MAGEAGLFGDAGDIEAGLAEEFGGAIKVDAADFIQQAPAHDAAKSAFEIAAAHGDFPQDVFNADLLGGVLADELGGLGDDFVGDAEDVGGVAGDDAVGRHFHRFARGGISFHEAVENLGGFEADFFGTEVDAGEGWTGHFVEENIVVDAEDGDFLGDGDAAFAADVYGVPGIAVVGGEDCAGAREGLDPFLGDFVGGGGLAEKRAFAAAFGGERVSAQDGPGGGGMSAESEGAKEAVPEIDECHFSHSCVIGEDRGDVGAVELAGGHGAGAIDHRDVGAAEAVEAACGVNHGDDAIDGPEIDASGGEHVHGRHLEFPVGAEICIGHDAAEHAASITARKVNLNSDSEHAGNRLCRKSCNLLRKITLEPGICKLQCNRG